MIWRFYVYVLFDIVDRIFGRQEYRYVGVATRKYRAPGREYDHSATSGAKSTRAWFRDVEAAGRQVQRKRLAYFNDAETAKLMEVRIWDAYKAAGHRLLNDRPLVFPKGAAMKGAAALVARRAEDPGFDVHIRLGNAKGTCTSLAKRAADPKLDARFRANAVFYGAKGPAATAKKRSVDPEFDIRFRAGGARGRAVIAAKRLVDPDFNAKICVGNAKGPAAFAVIRAADPELDATWRASCRPRRRPA